MEDLVKNKGCVVKGIFKILFLMLILIEINLINQKVLLSDLFLIIFNNWIPFKIQINTIKNVKN